MNDSNHEEPARKIAPGDNTVHLKLKFPDGETLDTVRRQIAGHGEVSRKSR